MPSYTATGGFNLEGASAFCYSQQINLKFGIGDIAFIKARAQKGKLEKICIKRVFVKTYQDVPLYKDTFNAVYFEPELVSHEEAISLALIFYNRELAEINSLF